MAAAKAGAMKWSWKSQILADPGGDAPGSQTASEYCTMMEENLMTDGGQLGQSEAHPLLKIYKI